MLRELAVRTNAIYLLMAVMGIAGVMAKAVNQMTMNQMLRAAGNMSRSTHRLIKLVRAKYEHACMVHDSVENTDAFVEKYIYEYRGFLFRIHTWRQIEILTIWFAGILAALGAFESYVTSGFSEVTYQYIGTGLAEMVLLSVVSRLSDEQYKLDAVKMYMVDYLENNCSYRMKRQRTPDREGLDVIAGENLGKEAETYTEKYAEKHAEKHTEKRQLKDPVFSSDLSSDSSDRNQNKSGVAGAEKKEKRFLRKPKVFREELPINIEGEPREVEPPRDTKMAIKEEARQAVREVLQERMEDEDRPALREEAIRQILEEFLA